MQEAKVETVMGAYNRTNGEPCCGSKTLLQDILRKEWGLRVTLSVTAARLRISTKTINYQDAAGIRDDGDEQWL